MKKSLTAYIAKNEENYKRQKHGLLKSFIEKSKN